MSTVQAVHAPAEVHSRPTVLALARVEARRFALHPLFFRRRAVRDRLANFRIGCESGLDRIPQFYAECRRRA